jgi:Zn-dependent protease
MASCVRPDFVEPARGYFPQAYPGYAELRYWITGLVATVLFFSSVLHELCHALMGNRLGEEIDRITLFIFGGWPI